LKFEFLLKTNVDLTSNGPIDNIERLCQSLIEKNLEINATEIDYEKAIENKTLRKLPDVLYPLRVRVVNIGEQTTGDFSAELCCGTHARNTQQLENFKIINFQARSDGYYEIDACTSDKASSIATNEKLLEDFYSEIKSTDQSTYAGMHRASVLSTQIELLQQNMIMSYIFMKNLALNMLDYRPSKRKLERELTKYFEDALKSLTDGNCLVYESILFYEQALSAFNKTGYNQDIILFNRFRKVAIVKSVFGNQAIYDRFAGYLNSKNIEYSVIEVNRHCKCFRFTGYFNLKAIVKDFENKKF
jgi:hypothetical protein